MMKSWERGVGSSGFKQKKMKTTVTLPQFVLLKIYFKLGEAA